MKKLKKGVCLAGVFAVIVLSLTSCGNSGSEMKSNSTGTIISGKVDVKYTERDISGTWDEASAVKVELSDTYAINKEGVYLFSGSLEEGQIIVNVSDTEKVQIVLNGASITNSSGPAILVENADKVFLTTAEGTENTLSDGTSYTSEEDQPWGTVFSKDDLTINGEGILKVTGNYNNGIVSKDDLRITGGTIEVTAKANGIKGKNSVGIYGGDIEVDSGDDGIKSDKEEEGKGYVSIDGGKVTVSGVTGQGIDAIYVAQVTGGELTIDSNNEGIQSKIVYISGGKIDVTAADDGLNATDGTITQSGDQAQEGVAVEIAGGETKVSASGDGIDSNGDLYITGGYTVVQGPGNGGNSSLDYNGVAEISGGTFVAFGAAEMAQNFSDGSTQCVLMYNMIRGDSGTELTLTDSDGKELISSQSEVDFGSVMVSTPDMKQGEKYTVKIGDSSETITMSNTIMIQGSAGVGGAMKGPVNNNTGGQIQSGAPK